MKKVFVSCVFLLLTIGCMTACAEEVSSSASAKNSEIFIEQEESTVIEPSYWDFSVPSDFVAKRIALPNQNEDHTYISFQTLILKSISLKKNTRIVF